MTYNFPVTALEVIPAPSRVTVASPAHRLAHLAVSDTRSGEVRQDTAAVEAGNHQLYYFGIGETSGDEEPWAEDIERRGKGGPTFHRGTGVRVLDAEEDRSGLSTRTREHIVRDTVRLS